MKAALHRLQYRWPVPIRELHTDNGGEFLNEMLLGYCKSHRIHFTRGRAYKKNDQAWVEQKNWATVRTFIGYDRYDTKDALLEMQRLYRVLPSFFNYFQPFRKTIDKTRHGARVTKRFDDAATPYRRLLLSAVLKPKERRLLKQTYDALNPVALAQRIERHRHQLWKLAAPRSDR